METIGEAARRLLGGLERAAKARKDEIESGHDVPRNVVGNGSRLRRNPGGSRLAEGGAVQKTRPNGNGGSRPVSCNDNRPAALRAYLPGYMEATTATAGHGPEDANGERAATLRRVTLWDGEK